MPSGTSSTPQCMGTALYRCGRYAFCQKHRRFAVARLQYRRQTMFEPKDTAKEAQNRAFDQRDKKQRAYHQCCQQNGRSKDRRS